MAEMMFRDGPREVLVHVEAMIRDAEVETMRYTYAEAVKIAEAAMAHEPFRTALESVRRDHLRRYG